MGGGCARLPHWERVALQTLIGRLKSIHGESMGGLKCCRKILVNELLHIYPPTMGNPALCQKVVNTAGGIFFAR